MTASEKVCAPDVAVPLSVLVDDVHVNFRVYQDADASLREFLRRGARRAVSIHALRGVSLAINVGESVGIVGSNGSGKSTLLRAIAGVQPVSSGKVFVRGEAHLLGVGAALKPLLSGQRNILLGGLAMGMPRSEIEAKLDEVVEFAGLQKSINLPMNTYSVGMRSRLAFAIATLRVPDVLLVDEALAVGDQVFRARSLARLRSLRDEAGAVVLVTHNLGEIRETCSRAIWLEQGEIRADGDVDDVLAGYTSTPG
jgi:teichoic acid transport system ATP-binding protein